MRTLFDSSMAVYNYAGMYPYELLTSILLIIHTFFANVLMMNFLIAILSLTYENLKETVIFNYKVNQY
jgi:hypothetical protein